MNQSEQSQLEHSLGLLGVEPCHGWDDIEKQYRQLAQKWHPDRNTGEGHEAAKSKFIEINAAYKRIRSHYRNTGSIPRHLPVKQREPNAPRERPGPLLGTKNRTPTKPAFYKNKFVIAGTITVLIAILFGALLWSLDSRLAENNRGRAIAEKTESKMQTDLSLPKPVPVKEEVPNQLSADTAL